jgi:hypothetical protein
MENKVTPAVKIVSCDECKHEWPYEDTNLSETLWKDDEDEMFTVLSFSCPNCGKQYIVCVDNEVTLSEREEVHKVQKAITRASKQGNVVVYNMLWNKRERLLARITKHQTQLMEAYLSRVERGVLEKVK